MPTHSPKALALILCLAFFASGTTLVHAGGQGEPRLAEVERLILQKDYASALRLLATIQRNDPNLRDETTRKMSQIMAVTRQFDAVLEQMNKAIEDGDGERTEQLAKELDDIDPVRAAGLGGAARFLVGFYRLMNSAQALLREGKPAEALSKYLLPFNDPAKAGVTLPQAQFEAAGYGDIIITGIGRVRGGIVSSAEQELKTAPDIPGILPAVRKLVNQPPPAEAAGEPSPASAQFDTLVAPLLQTAAAEGSARAGAALLEEMNRSIQLASDKGRTDPYVQYLLWLWLGRDSVRGKTPEGVAHALRQLWMDSAQSVADATSEGVTSAFESARSLYESGSYAAADAGFQGIPARSLLAVKATALASARYGMSGATGWRLPDGDSGAIRI